MELELGSVFSCDAGGNTVPKVQACGQGTKVNKTLPKGRQDSVQRFKGRQDSVQRFKCSNDEIGRAHV